MIRGLLGALATLVVVPLGVVAADSDAGAADANARAEAAGAQGALVARLTASRVRVRSDRRPMGAGVYDAAAQKTFISFMGKNSDAYVQAYDHRTDTWTPPKQVGSSFADKHNYPVMVQADDGRLLVFHGAHNSPLKLSTAPEPHSIDGEWTDRGLGDVAPYHASYPMALKADNGDIYVFIRDTLKEDDPSQYVDDRPMQYLLSTDDGRTWTSSGELTGAPYAIGSEREDNLDEVYMGEIAKEPARSGRPERWHLVWTMAGGGPGNHGHGTIIRDFYYASFQPSNRHFYDVRGNDLGTHIDQQEMLERTLAVETDHSVPHGSYLTNPLVVLADGTPVFFYHRRTADTDALTAARWTGERWEQVPTSYDVGIWEAERIGPDRVLVYADPRDGRTGIQTLVLDAGDRWSQGPFVPTGQALNKVCTVDGGHGPVRAVAEGDTGTTDQTVDIGDIYAVGSGR